MLAYLKVSEDPKFLEFRTYDGKEIWKDKKGFYG
jgi:hypothetical protein